MWISKGQSKLKYTKLHLNWAAKVLHLVPPNIILFLVVNRSNFSSRYLGLWRLSQSLYKKASWRPFTAASFDRHSADNDKEQTLAIWRTCSGQESRQEISKTCFFLKPFRILLENHSDMSIIQLYMLQKLCKKVL